MPNLVNKTTNAANKATNILNTAKDSVDCLNKESKSPESLFAKFTQEELADLRFATSQLQNSVDELNKALDKSMEGLK